MSITTILNTLQTIKFIYPIYRYIVLCLIQGNTATRTKDTQLYV